MSRQRRPPRQKQGALTEEDEALWSLVAQTIEPVRTKGRVHARERDDMSAEGRDRLFVEKSRSTTGPSQPQRDASSALSRPAAKTKTPPPLADYDRRQVKRIAAGRMDIEARIDLHGMRANEAHSALRAFIFRCHAQDKRTVLVITGKGMSEDLRDRPFELDDRRDRGVLKRHVPLWLAEPDLRAVVVSFTTAHARHGGEGALYVQIRSRTRAAVRRE
jgi:DNA-nicking Smr family endonuclease